MEIHAPEGPVTSLKEFLVHIGIVTIGILLTAQVLQKEAIEELYKVKKEHTRQIEQLCANGSETDKRIRDLVSAIGGVHSAHAA
jgi:hypothetical protein